MFNKILIALGLKKKEVKRPVAKVDTNYFSNLNIQEVDRRARIASKSDYSRSANRNEKSRRNDREYDSGVTANVYYDPPLHTTYTPAAVDTNDFAPSGGGFSGGGSSGSWSDCSSSSSSSSSDSGGSCSSGGD